MPTLQNALLPPLDFRASFPLLRSLLLPSSGAAPDKPAAPEFELVEHVGADRASVEAFISQRFAESFGSRIEAFMPRLFSVRSRDGEIRGAFGLRSAHCKLFLEQYLDAPIEQVIAARTGTPVGRRPIIEVGHFSGAFPGAVRA